MEPAHIQLQKNGPGRFSYGSNPVSDYALSLIDMKRALMTPEEVQILKEAAVAWDPKKDEGEESVFRVIKRGDKSFDDVIGSWEEKRKIRESVIAPFLLPNFFGEAPKGILFYGPPGGGKTLLAEATITELSLTLSKSLPLADVALIIPSPADLKGKYVGESEKKITELFKVAKNRKCEEGKTMKMTIIFIDEIDGLVQSRTGQSTENVGNSVATFLQELDGVKGLSTVILVGATNFPQNIDEAVKRRMPVKIPVDLPSAEDLALWLKWKVSKFIWIDKDRYFE